MVGDGDGTAGTGALANGDVLVEGGSALDRRLVNLGVLPDAVRSAIARKSPLLSTLLRVADRVLYDVILDERVSTPTVLEL